MHPGGAAALRVTVIIRAPGDDWFAMQMISQVAGVKATIVPFPGDGPSWQAARRRRVTGRAAAAKAEGGEPCRADG